MSMMCHECKAMVADGEMTCPVCGMPMKSALEKIAFAREWQAFVAGEKLLVDRIRSCRTRTKAAQEKDRNRLSRVQVEWKNLLVRMCDAGVRPRDLPALSNDSLPCRLPCAPKKSKKTESHGSRLTNSSDHSTTFINGNIKIHPDGFHIWFNNVGWYEVKPNCAWAVLDRILDQSRNKPAYQKAPFTFGFTRLDGIALGKAVAVDKGPAGRWLRKKSQKTLSAAVLDKNPGCEARHKLTTAAFKQIIYDTQVL